MSGASVLELTDEPVVEIVEEEAQQQKSEVTSETNDVQGPLPKATE